MRVLVTDVNGAPLSGVAVSFAVTSGTGNLVNPATLTDANGLAQSDFFAQTPANGNDFEYDTIVATTPYGAVSFTQISYATFIIGSSSPAFPPTVTILTPTDPDHIVTVAEGSVAPNAFTAQILAISIPL